MVTSKFKVLALNPPFHPRYSRSQRSPGVIKSGVLYYPLWLAYATGVLEQDGFQVRLVDAPAAGFDFAAVIELLGEFQPQLVLMETSTPSILNDLEVARAVKARFPGMFVLLIGSKTYYASSNVFWYAGSTQNWTTMKTIFPCMNEQGIGQADVPCEIEEGHNVYILRREVLEKTGGFDHAIGIAVEEVISKFASEIKAGQFVTAENQFYITEFQ